MKFDNVFKDTTLFFHYSYYINNTDYIILKGI